ncbi:hypothetical protein AAMO2058_000511600 [Amorphochlora amoebiformis]
MLERSLYSPPLPAKTVISRIPDYHHVRLSTLQNLNDKPEEILMLSFCIRHNRFHLTHHGYLRVLRPEVEDIRSGLLTLHILDTDPCGLMLNEKADPAISSDLRAAFDRIFGASDGKDTDISPFDLAYAKSAIVGSSLTIPIVDRELALGSWQGFYLCDFGEFPQSLERSKNFKDLNDILKPTPDRPGERYLVATIQEFPSGKARIFNHPVPSRGVLPLDTTYISNLTSLEESSSSEAIRDHSLKSQETRDISGIFHVMVRHTSASLAARPLGEDARRLETLISCVCPDKWTREGLFQHDYEGADDMPGHVKSGLLGPTASIPIVKGGLEASMEKVGQRIEFWEHRECMRTTREVVACLSDADMRAVHTVHLGEAREEVLDVTTSMLQSIREDIKEMSVGLVHLWSTQGVPIAICKEGNTAAITGGLVSSMMEGEDGPVECVRSAVLGVKVSLPVAGGQVLISPGHRIYAFPGVRRDSREIMLTVALEGT